MTRWATYYVAIFVAHLQGPMKVFATLLTVILVSSPCALALWPIPRSLKTGTTLVKLSSSFSIDISVENAPQDLLNAVFRTKTQLFADKLGRLVVGRGVNDTTALAQAPVLNKLTLSLSSGAASAKSIMQEATKDIASRSEGYSLTLPATGGTATISASSTLGLFRGLTTFEQLFYTTGDTVYVFQAPVTITNDSPAFVRMREVLLLRAV